MARAWKLLGYDEPARNEAKKAVELSSNLPPRDQRSIEAEYHELNSQWDQAIAIYRSLGVIYPDEPNYALLLANAQTSAGKGQQALGTLAALAKEPQMKDDPRVDLSVALAAESLSDVHKQRDAAESAAEKATQQESRLLAAHAYWQLCSAYYALGEFQKGESACDASSSAARSTMRSRRGRKPSLETSCSRKATTLKRWKCVSKRSTRLVRLAPKKM